MLPPYLNLENFLDFNNYIYNFSFNEVMLSVLLFNLVDRKLMRTYATISTYMNKKLFTYLSKKKKLLIVYQIRYTNY